MVMASLNGKVQRKVSEVKLRKADVKAEAMEEGGVDARRVSLHRIERLRRLPRSEGGGGWKSIEPGGAGDGRFEGGEVAVDEEVGKVATLWILQRDARNRDE